VYQKGQALVRSGKPAEAASLWRAASLEARKQQPSAALWMLFRSAILLMEAHQWAEVDGAYEAAVQQAEGEGPFAAIYVLHIWARSCEMRGNFSDAEKHYESALTRVKDFGEGLSLAAILNEMGTAEWRRNDLPRAEQLLHNALDIRNKLAPNSIDLAWTFNNLGLVAADRGDIDAAKEFYEQALAIQQRLVPDSADVASSFNNLGSIAGEHGDVVQADEYFRKVVAITEKVDPQGNALPAALGNLGILAKERGDLAEAEKYYLRCLEIGEKLGIDDLGMAWNLENLGYVVLARGDLDRAEKLYRRTAEIRERLTPQGLPFASSLNDLGFLAVQRGNLSGAEDYFRRAFAIQDKSAPESPDTFENLMCLADVLRVRGNLDQAEEFYRRAKDIQEKQKLWGEATIYEGLGNVARDRGNLDKAEEYYRRSIASWKDPFPRPIDWARTLASLASVLQHKGQYDAAAPLFAQALEAFESQTDRLGGIDEERAGFRARNSNYYMNYVDLLMAQNKPGAGLEVLERSRARSLLETLATAHVDLRAGVDPQLLRKERLLQEQLRAKSNYLVQLLNQEHREAQAADLRKELASLLDGYHEAEERIRADSPAYSALTQPRPLTLENIQRLLDPDTLLVEYALGETRSYVWAVGAKSLATFELPKGPEIEALARSVYSALTARNRVDKDESAAQRMLRIEEESKRYSVDAEALSSKILGPLVSLIRGKRLLIVSDGALHYVPFGALPTPSPRLGQQDVFMPLVVEHEIVNLPSASVLEVLREESARRGKSAKMVAILADPVFDAYDERVKNAAGRSATRVEVRSAEQAESTETALADDLLLRSATEVGSLDGELHFSRLVFSRREANAINRLAAAGKAMRALDFQANRATATGLELGQYRIVHFATHGLLNSEHPELSGLVLSLVDERGRHQDGFLNLTDIYNLHLPVDMVVLSACETALGREIRGEGLVGLTRGFMHAGASRVVASLWKVDDAGTAELMENFYKGMLKEKLQPAAALRKAQVQMWRQSRWRSPYYWAGFVLQGLW
jgi:CHAT domain-containing protein/Tfp pilus assembly protein PilF